MEARYVKQTACGVFAIATVDFEPGRWGGFELAVPEDVRFVFPVGGDLDHRCLFPLLDALAAGIREELEADRRILIETRAVLRRMVVHEVDSGEHAFRTAGRIAARAALGRAFDG